MPSNITMVPSYGMGATVTDKRWTPTDVASPALTNVFAATQDIKTMDTYLATADGVYWTTVRLAQESIWDKLFWIRSQIANNGGLA